MRRLVGLWIMVMGEEEEVGLWNNDHGAMRRRSDNGIMRTRSDDESLRGPYGWTTTRWRIMRVGSCFMADALLFMRDDRCFVADALEFRSDGSCFRANAYNASRLMLHGQCFTLTTQFTPAALQSTTYHPHEPHHINTAVLASRHCIIHRMTHLH
jgi:hypothetical protein